MLSELNNIIKEYEPIINFSWAIFPFIVTIFMAYIAYQQWIIIKRNSNIAITKETKENLYKPLKKKIGFIIYSLCTHTYNKKYLTEIKNLFKQYPYVVNEYNNELIKYSFDLICRFNRKKKTVIIIENSWKIYKKGMQWLLNACIPDEIRINVYPNKIPNIYSIIKNIVKVIYKFLTPYFLQDKINNIYTTLGFYFWLWVIIIHIAIQSFFKIIYDNVKHLKEQQEDMEKDNKLKTNEKMDETK